MFQETQIRFKEEEALLGVLGVLLLKVLFADLSPGVLFRENKPQELNNVVNCFLVFASQEEGPQEPLLLLLLFASQEEEPQEPLLSVALLFPFFCITFF